MDNALSAEDELVVDEFIANWNDAGEVIESSTSGTTGAGKKIKLRKADMKLSAQATIDFLELDRRGLTFVIPINTRYIGGKMMVVRSMLVDARRIVLHPSLDPLGGLPTDVDHIDLLAIVPAQVEALLENDCRPPIDNIIIGGAPLPTQLERRLVEEMPEANIYSTFGMTETCSHVALRRVGERCFHAMPGVSFGVDNAGQLTILHAQASWSPMPTRDIVRLVSPVEMEWVGRADNLINTGGIKVSAEQIEGRLAAIEMPGEFYITARPHPQWGEAVTLVIEGEWVRTDKLMAEMKKILPRRLVPKAIEFRSQFERTATGKVRRR